uniref:Putative secreted protein n=1 Tax=Anopheles darlingi TaxID=43151 RepID=A0A2M4D6P5_ANODA
MILRRNSAAFTMALSFLAPARRMMALMSSTSVRWISTQLAKSVVRPVCCISIQPRFITSCTVRLVAASNLSFCSSSKLCSKAVRTLRLFVISRCSAPMAASASDNINSQLLSLNSLSILIRRILVSVCHRLASMPAGQLVG